MGLNVQIFENEELGFELFHFGCLLFFDFVSNFLGSLLPLTNSEGSFLLGIFVVHVDIAHEQVLVKPSFATHATS